MKPSYGTLGSAYVQLALAIDQHIPGYIDANFGPPEWKDTTASQGKRPLEELMAQVGVLERTVVGKTQIDPQRADFLRHHLRAMDTSLRLLQGEALSLTQEV